MHAFFFFSLFQRALGSTQHRDHDSSSLEAEHRSYEPGVAGSIPAWSILSACSVMVIIDASQALDPGSIPGRRSHRAFVFVVPAGEKNGCTTQSFRQCTPM